MGRLSEDVSDLRKELRNCQRGSHLPTQVHTAHAHQHTAGIFCRLGKEIMPLLFLNLGNGKLEVFTTERENLDIVLVLDLILYLEGRIIGLSGTDLDVLGTQLVVNNDCRVRAQLEGSVVLLGLFLLCRLLAACFLARETLIYLLEIRNLAVELLKIETSVKRAGRLACNLVTRRDLINDGSAVPTVSGVIAGICRNPAQNGNLAEGRLIGYCKRLVVAPRSTQTPDGVHDRVTPVTILVGEEFAVNLSDRFHDVGGRVAVESSRQRLGKVP